MSQHWDAPRHRGHSPSITRSLDIHPPMSHPPIHKHTSTIIPLYIQQIQFFLKHFTSERDMDYSRAFPLVSGLIGLLFLGWILDTNIKAPVPYLLAQHPPTAVSSLLSPSKESPLRVSKSRNLRLLSCGNQAYLWSLLPLKLPSPTPGVHRKAFEFQVHAIHPQNPSLSTLLLNTTLEGEAMRYKASNECLEDGPSLLVLSKRKDEETVSYHGHALYMSAHQQPELKTFEFPGNLGFSRIASSHRNVTVYARTEDDYLFRIMDQGRDTRIKGPLKKEFPGNLLALIPLHTPTPGTYAIFTIRYQTFSNSDHFSVAMTIFYKLGDKENDDWQSSTLWQEVLGGMEDGVISIHASYRLHFLSSPVIGESNDRKTLAFVFLHQIFTIEFNPNLAQGANFRLYKHHLKNTKIEARDILVSNSSLSIVSEENEIFFFSRNFNPPSSTYIESPLLIKWLKPYGYYRLLVPHLERRKSSLMDAPPPWKLEKEWSSKLSRDVHSKDITTFSHSDSLVHVLYEDLSLVTLDVSRQFGRSSRWALVTSRWELVVTVLVVTALFVMNEFRILAQPERLPVTPHFLNQLAGPMFIFTVFMIVTSLL